MRLDRYVSKSLGIPRRIAKKLILKGRIRVDGETIRDPSKHVEGAEVSLDGRVIDPPREKVYLILHKPAGFVTSTRDEEPTVLDLVDHPRVGELHPVGRLDKDATGLLILTNDGEFTHKVISRKSRVEREYEVVVDGRPEEAFKLLDGVRVDGEKVRAIRMSIVDERTIRVVVDEGRYHLVKRMLSSVGLRVLKLKRIRMGGLVLDVPEGEWRELSEEEVRRVLE